MNQDSISYELIFKQDILWDDSLMCQQISYQ